MTEQATPPTRNRLARAGTVLGVIGAVLLLGGVIAVLKGNQSARIAAGADALLGQQQYGPYMGEWVAMLGWAGVVLGALAIIGYAVAGYLGRQR